MKIISVADTHASHRDLKVPDGDIFIHAGDISYFNRSRKHYIDFNEWIGGLPHKYKLVIPGNHDKRFQYHPEEIPELTSNYIYLNDKEIVIDGIKFYGSGYTPWFYGWAFNLPRGPKLAEKWSLIPEDCDVLITHGPPFQICDSAGGIDVGCEDLLKRVFEVKPKLHLFGHVHESRGKYEQHGNTLFCNISMNDSNKPYEIELNDIAEMIGEEDVEDYDANPRR